MTVGNLERVKGIEPSYEAWEAAVLPLNYTRVRSRKFKQLQRPKRPCQAISNGQF